MSRKIITKNELTKINQQYETEREELVSSILTESEQLFKKTGGRRSIKKSDEEKDAESKIDSMILELGSKPANKADSYSDRLMKYIPTEIIALYITLDTIIRSSGGNSSSTIVINWIVFLFCILAIILVLLRKDKVKSMIQISVSVGAFAVWIFALGGPFLELGWYETLYGALLLPAYTFLVPFIKPEE